MTSEKASYWLVLVAFAFVFSNHFLDSHGATLHAISARSMAAIERMSNQAARVEAVADPTMDASSVRTARYQARVACAEARLASVGTAFARRQAVMAQADVQRALDREP